MPSVRWKFLLKVSVFCLVQVMVYTDAQHMQESISMTADGWRPIIGTRREPTFNHEEITHYRNPIRNNEPIKASVLGTTPSTTTTVTQTTLKTSSKALPTSPPPLNFIHHNHPGPGFFGKGKIPHSKHPGANQYFMLGGNHGVHGPHIPLGAVTHGRPGQTGLVKKIPVKHHLHGPPKGKRIVKPVYRQSTAPSTRNEVYVPAPNSGSYSFFTQGNSNLRPRDVPGLGLSTNNLYSGINQPHGHVEYSHHFPQNGNVFKQFSNHHPQPPPLYKKPNDIHYHFENHEDYTRNLVPPPLHKTFQEKANTLQPLQKLNEATATAGTTERITLGTQTTIPENHPVKLPTSYEEHQFEFPHQNIDQQSNIQITKEQLKVFHNDIPHSFNSPPNEYDFQYHGIRNTGQVPKYQTYEVTEGRWHENTPFYTRIPPDYETTQRLRKPSRVRPLNVDLGVPPFLPTPYNADGVVPTSPTQNDVSTIYSQLSNAIREKPETVTVYPNYFDVKEVSTHYPIVGRPNIETQFEITPEIAEVTNEITTNKHRMKYSQQYEEPLSTVGPNKISTTRDPYIKPRPNQRRRRPTTTTATTTTTEEPSTEYYEPHKSYEENDAESVEIEKPVKLRRPSRYRTTTPSSDVHETKSQRGKNRYRNRTTINDFYKTSDRKRVRPNNIEHDYVRKNHRTTEADVPTTEYSTEMLPVLRQSTTTEIRPTMTQENIDSQSYDSNSEEVPNTESVLEFDEEIYRKNPTKFRYEKPIRHYEVPTEYEEDTNEDYQTTSFKNLLSVRPYEQSEEVTEKPKRSRTREPVTTTEALPTTNLHLPENEVDFSTNRYDEIEPTTQNEEELVKLVPSTLPTITEPPITKPSRIRRPVKYDSSNRPRFSVKDYRQRLNQYSSTSTTESSKVSNDSPRIRFSTRLRRPTSTSNTPFIETVSETVRPKFTPKEHRRSTTTVATDVIKSEKSIKSVNTKLRPFGRFKQTTSSSTTVAPRVSIRPNLFANRRRPPQLSLRSRISGGNNKTNPIENKVIENSIPGDSQSETTLQENTDALIDNPTTMEYGFKKVRTTDVNEVSETTTNDLLKNEASLYSQRVSDLTSSAKNDYNTPGVFKSVSPSSRRVPSYFTISTDDPILPIEAFFPLLKEKDKQKE